MNKPYELRWEPDAVTDLLSLNQADPQAADAAQQTARDVAAKRKRGKALGDRHVSGDLTGLYRLKFDTDDQGPQRYRLVYRIEPNTSTVVIVIIGLRAQHAVYHDAAEREKKTD